MRYETMNRLYTMVGLPGSGKSTFTKNHTECVVVSTDAIRAELFGSEECQENGSLVFEIAFKRIREALAQGRDVIFDATNVSRKARKSVFQFNAEHIAIFIDTDVEECKRRNAQRERKVPEFVIDRMASRLVIPTVAEGFEKVLIF